MGLVGFSGRDLLEVHLAVWIDSHHAHPRPAAATTGGDHGAGVYDLRMGCGTQETPVVAVIILSVEVGVELDRNARHHESGLAEVRRSANTAVTLEAGA